MPCCSNPCLFLKSPTCVRGAPSLRSFIFLRPFYFCNPPLLKCHPPPPIFKDDNAPSFPIFSPLPSLLCSFSPPRLKCSPHPSLFGTLFPRYADGFLYLFFPPILKTSEYDTQVPSLQTPFFLLFFQNFFFLFSFNVSWLKLISPRPKLFLFDSFIHNSLVFHLFPLFPSPTKGLPLVFFPINPSFFLCFPPPFAPFFSF